MFSRTAEHTMDDNILSLIVDSIALLEVKITKYFPRVDFKKYYWVRNPLYTCFRISNLVGLKISVKNLGVLKMTYIAVKF